MGKKSRWPRTILRRNHWKVGVPTYSPLALRPRPSTPPTSTSLSTYLMPSSSSSSSAPSFFGSFCGSNVRSALETGGSSSFLLGGALWLDAPAPLPGLVCLAAEGAASLRPGFAERVLRAARAAADLPSFGTQFIWSAATAAACVVAVVFLHERNLRLADDRNLAEWRQLAAGVDELDSGEL